MTQGPQQRDPFWTGLKAGLGCIAAVVVVLIGTIVVLFLIQFVIGFVAGLTGA